MNRRAFLGALASGGAAMLAGCTSERETLQSVSTTVEIPGGEFFHHPLRVDAKGKQFNLRYEVTADEPFDVFLFGGQVAPEEFTVYQRAVHGRGGGVSREAGGEDVGGNGEPASGRGDDTEGDSTGESRADPSAHTPRHTSRSQESGQGSERGSRSERGNDTGGGPRSGTDGQSSGGPSRPSGSRRQHPKPSDWHSVVGTRQGEVNKPLRPGIHHFVVDNTRLGEAPPTDTLRPDIDLAVRDFELFSG